MRRVLVGLVLGLLVASLLPAAAAQAAPGRYIVVLKDSVSNPRSVASEHARDHGAQVSHVYRFALKGYAAAISDSGVRRIQSDSRVAYVSEDRVVQALDHPANAPTGVHRVFAPDNAEIDIDGLDDFRVDVDIAIIDTGIDVDHPDLNVVGGKNCESGKSFDDGHGHGTHVAGTAAGKDNGSGAVGMAPGARLWAVRVLNNGGLGSTSGVVCGIDWVAGQNSDSSSDNDIEVANMSLGGSGSDDGNCGNSNNDAEHKAICNAVGKGVTFAVAAGNDSADAANHIPAAYDEVITVSALADFDGVPGGLGSPTCRSDEDDTFANFSNFGADVDIIAPGVCIFSTWKGGGTNTISGTSMASPHVAGAAALYKATSTGAGASPAEVKAKLQATGNSNWNDGDDPDSTKEVLLDVSSADFDPVMVGEDTGGSDPPANSAPVANNDSATTDKDTSVTIPVLANDDDADGDPLTVSIVTLPATGSAVVNTDNTVTYTPAAGFTGQEWFAYTANDGTADSNEATVTVDVVEPSATPALSVSVAKVGDTYTSGPWYRADLKVTVTDGTNPVESASVTLEVRATTCTGASQGSASGTTGSDGTVTFTFRSRTQGDYCALASATKSGYDPGSGSVLFVL